MKTKAIVFTAPEQVEIREYELPPLSEDQMLIKTLLTGVSTGTETRVWRGRQSGSQFPLVPGYENVGVVIRAGSKSGYAEGQKVFSANQYTGPYHKCWGAQVEYSVADSKSVYALPDRDDEESLKGFIFAKVGAIAHHGVDRAGVSNKDTVIVVGQGLIGHLAAQIALSRGATVLAADVSEERLALSRKAGIEKTFNPSRVDLIKEVHAYCGGVDVSIDATGKGALADQSIRLVRPRPWEPPYPPHPRFVILGSPTDPVSFDYNSSLFQNEPDIFPSRDVTPYDFEESIRLIGEGKINPHHIDMEMHPYGKAPACYRELAEGRIMRLLYDWR